MTTPQSTVGPTIFAQEKARAFYNGLRVKALIQGGLCVAAAGAAALTVASPLLIGYTAFLMGASACCGAAALGNTARSLVHRRACKRLTASDKNGTAPNQREGVFSSIRRLLLSRETEETAIKRANLATQKPPEERKPYQETLNRRANYFTALQGNVFQSSQTSRAAKIGLLFASSLVAFALPLSGGIAIPAMVGVALTAALGEKIQSVLAEGARKQAVIAAQESLYLGYQDQPPPAVSTPVAAQALSAQRTKAPTPDVQQEPTNGETPTQAKKPMASRAEIARKQRGFSITPPHSRATSMRRFPRPGGPAKG